MSETKSPKYSAAELADTGRWHLTVRISDAGAGAWLTHLTDGTEPSRVFSLEFDDSEPLCEQLERALYDNPKVLDDYSADIIIETPRELWVPAAEADDDRLIGPVIEQVWPELAPEAMADRSSGETCVFAPGQGMAALLHRTFPGARISSRTSVLRSLLPPAADPPQVLIDLSCPGRMTVVGVGSQGLALALCRDSNTPAQLGDTVAQWLETCGLSAEATIITVNSNAEGRPGASELSEALAQAGFKVTLSDGSALRGAPGLPLDTAVCATRRSRPAFSLKGEEDNCLRQ